MAEKQVQPVDAFLIEFQAQLADTGSRVQHDNTRPASDFDARSVPTAT
jgi:hypothetical protein